MPIYNVQVTFETTMVVVADDEDDARAVARTNALSAIEDADECPGVDVRGEVTREQHLRDGWDGDCVPYGGDRNTRLRDLLTPNVQDQQTPACGRSAATTGYATDGTGN